MFCFHVPEVENLILDLYCTRLFLLLIWSRDKPDKETKNMRSGVGSKWCSSCRESGYMLDEGSMLTSEPLWPTAGSPPSG